MKKAIWKDKLIAVTDNYEIVDGNYYFSSDSVKQEYLRKSDSFSTFHCKGFAIYCDIVINGEVNKDAAWYYPEMKTAANKIKNYIAF
jgi:uncharacterized protein (DUF427 family)